MSNTKSNSDEIMVSICCLVYNHEKYLRQCLDGFLMQKTSFKYEILIHDDASTDSSADIIREYEKKYPDIVKPIYQTENQYSKGVKISWEFQYPRVKGKYIALCEGDDYWCDENKLQKQFMIMEQNRNISICATKVRHIKENGERLNIFYPEKNIKTGIIDNRELMELLYTTRFQTSSYFFRSQYILDILNDIPRFITEFPVGDTTIILYNITRGNMYYLDEETSCYRLASDGSWTIRVKRDINKNVTHVEGLINGYRLFDEYSKYKYHDLILNYNNKLQYYVYVMRENYKQAIRIKDEFRKEPTKIKLFYWLSAYFPIFNKLYKVRKELKCRKTN